MATDGRIVRRPRYLERLLAWQDRDVIKVVTGARRAGKSTLLQMFARHLAASGISAECITTIDLEDYANRRLLEGTALYDAVTSRLVPDTMNYVLIDEVQNVVDATRVIDGLYRLPNVDLYLTGSNALLLRGSLATLLSGRYIEVSVLPFSFAEFVEAKRALGQDPDPSLPRLFDRYMRTGGFPVVATDELDERMVHDYLEGILNTVLYRDVAQRLGARNIVALSALVSFLFDNIGNPTSPNALSDELRRAGVTLSPNTLGEYLTALTNSYMFYPAQRYDLKGKRLLKLGAKYYGVDMGLRRVVLGHANDLGRILENNVYLELLSRGLEVRVGWGSGREVDFVCDGADGRSFYQVAWSVADPSTLERELTPLRSLASEGPCRLLTTDDRDPVRHGAIVQENVFEWMLGRERP